MNIKYAILGFLSWRPFSGYDLKKLFAGSTVLHWSGNNNQIYSALVELHDEVLVSYQVQPQESVPAKKVYSITEAGRLALDAWVHSNPEPPEVRNTFLVQLAWADLLAPAELDALLQQYEDEVQVQMLMLSEEARRANATPGRTPREAFLWEKIHENLISRHENELNWVRSLRAELKAKFPEKERLQ